MASPVLILSVGLLFSGLFVALAFLKREGFSRRFLIEALAITAAFTALSLAAGPIIDPVVFLIILYVLPMRARLLVDLANLFARRGDYASAERIYAFSLRLPADAADRLIVRINRAVCTLKQGDAEEAAAVFREALEQAAGAGLGLKYRTGCHYNLGICLRKKGLEEEARAEFKKVLELWPVSEAARQAAQALKPRA